MHSPSYRSRLVRCWPRIGKGQVKGVSMVPLSCLYPFSMLCVFHGDVPVRNLPLTGRFDVPRGFEGNIHRDPADAVYRQLSICREFRHAGSYSPYMRRHPMSRRLRAESKVAVKYSSPRRGYKDLNVKM